MLEFRILIADGLDEHGQSILRATVQPDSGAQLLAEGHWAVNNYAGMLAEIAD